jgi:undecaprenyl diphosphate synthase
MTFPKHIAIIMDGNGRWAQQRSRPRTFGHIKGARAAKKIITHCVKLGVKELTLFAFSTENWSRPKDEVSFLMTLLERYIRREREQLIKENIRFRVIGRMDRLPEKIIHQLELTRNETAKNTGLTLTFALNYGGRQEIVDVFQSLAEQVKLGLLDPKKIDEKTVDDCIKIRSVMDPDLVIRTSGEMRLSNFLIWQSAYSELYFSETLWPEFTVDCLDLAISEFEKRERRFGMTSSQVSRLKQDSKLMLASSKLELAGAKWLIQG